MRLSILFNVLFFANVFIFNSFDAKASHIIGGELNLVHIAQDSFRISLHVYYDQVNSVLDVVDNQVEIHAFSEATQQKIESFILSKSLDRELPYSSLGCRIANFITREIVYSKIVKLDPSNYAQIAGYYLAWERCCRNGVLDNIENSGEEGLAVYLNFPPLMQAGKFTPNSSPVFSNLTGDYACLNQWYFVDFEAYDDDNDDLKFSLVNPLGGHATFLNNNPNPQPKPYNLPAIQWKSLQGYSVNTQVRGTPSLEISETGRLRVKPIERGLFVFAVRCEEFRNGKKIGEKVREFQILVQECTTPKRNFPNANAFQTISAVTPIAESDTVEFEMDEIDKRIYIKVTDQDADSVRIRALPVRGFTQGAIISDSLGLLPNGTDYHVFTVSYPHCPEDSGRVYADRFFISDLTCGQPYEDTVTVFVRVKEKIHQQPFISVLADSSAAKEFIFEGVQYDTIAIPMGWSDDDADSIIYLNVSHFRDSLPQNPFTDSVRIYSAIDQDTLFWAVPCDLFKGTADTVLTYHFPIIVTDNVRCGFEKRDTVDIQVLIRNRHNVRYNTRPEIIAKNRNPISDTIPIYLDTAYLTKPYEFHLQLTDLQGDSIFIKWEAENFKPLDFQFPIDSIKTDSLANFFMTWTPRCGYLDTDSLYKSLKTRIIVQDFSVCDTMIYSDTLYLDLTLTSDNRKPDIWTKLPDNQYDITLKDSIYSDTLPVNRFYRIPINAPDFEADTVVMRLNTPLDSVLHQYKLYRNVADSSLKNEHFFEWQPNCEYFSDPDSIYPIPIEFIATDLDTCFRQKSDTLRTIFYVRPDRERTFEPYFLTKMDSIAPQFYVDSAKIGSPKTIKIGAKGLGVLAIKYESLSPDFLTITPDFVSVLTAPDSMQSQWTWNMDCRYFSDFDSLPKFLDIQFRVNSYACTENLADTATVRLFLSYPESLKPDLKIINLTDTLQTWQTSVTAGNPLHFALFSDSIPAGSVLRIDTNFDTLRHPIRTQIIRQDSILKYSFSMISECSKDSSDFNLRYILADTSACNFGADTVFISVKILPTPNENHAPKLNLNFNDNINNSLYMDSVFIGEKFTLNVFGGDTDLDSLFLTPIAQNFHFEAVGAEFLSISAHENFSTVFSWQTSCKALNITGQDFESKTFEFDLILKDKKYCLPILQDSVRVRWTVLGRPELNQSPDIQLDIAQNSEKIYVVEIKEGSTISIPINVVDTDEDVVILEAFPENFSFSEMGIQFVKQQKNAPYSLDFQWNTDCHLVENEAKNFNLKLTAKDLPICGNPLTDEAQIQIRVIPENQIEPEILVDLPQNSDEIYESKVFENELFMTKFRVQNFDKNAVEWAITGENFSLEEIGATFTQNSDFEPVLSWTPKCDLSLEQSDFQFVITAKIPTSGCRAEGSKNIRLRLEVEPHQATFEPPTNVLTPNGDGKNDVFYLPNVVDNCGKQTFDFQRIEIFNRWGNRIFESDNPTFEWNPKDAPAGVYFYAMQIGNQEVYRGNMTVIK